MKKFFQSLHFHAERYMALPNKILDTRAIFVGQIIFCLVVYGAILTAQLTIVNRCILPVPSSFVK